MSAPSQEYLDFLQQGQLAGTLTEQQQTNYANALRNNRFEPVQATPVDIIGGLQPLEQSQAYVDQAYGGEDIRGSGTSAPNGSYYGAPQDSYNVQEIQAAADALRASGQPLTQGNKVYDTGIPQLNEALYGPDISRNISGDGTQGFRTPRQFDPNYAAEFFAAIPESVATFYGGQILGAGLGKLVNGMLGGASATTGNAAQAQAVIDNAITNPIFNVATEYGGQALDAYDTYGAAANVLNSAYQEADNPYSQGGLNGMIVGTDVNGQPIFIPDQELSGGSVTPTEESGGGGADSNDTAAAEASQAPSESSTQPLEGTVVQDSEKPEDPQGFRWVPTGDAESPEWTLIQIDDPADAGEEDSGLNNGLVFGSDNPFINPLTGEPYFGTSELPSSDVEFSQGQVLEGNPTEQVAYDPDAVFGSDDPNINPATGEAYVDFSTPDNLGGFSSGGVGTGGTGNTGSNGSGDGNNGTGDGPGGDGSGDGGLNAGGLLAAGAAGGNWEDFMAVPNYTYQLLQSPEIRMMDFMADYLPNRNTRR